MDISVGIEAVLLCNSVSRLMLLSSGDGAASQPLPEGGLQTQQTAHTQTCMLGATLPCQPLTHACSLIEWVGNSVQTSLWHLGSSTKSYALDL
jgi:hypothetical protein